MERIAVIMGKMHSGGKKSLVMEYYRHINRKEIQFDFICDDDSNAIPYDEIEKLGGRVYVVPPYQKIIHNMRSLYKIFKENNYTIVHGYNGTMNIFSMYVAKKAKIPIRINESISMAHFSDKKTIIKNILKSFSKCFSTHYLSNGEACGKWQFGEKLFNQGKVEVFKTIINTDENLYNEVIRNQVREEYKISENVVIGHIGRLTEQKNTLFLIDVFYEIYSRNKLAKLLIIGDGNLKEQMLDKIDKLGLEEAVLYLGRREDIDKFYNVMDCFLLPSLYEGLPVVGIEAQNHGLPVFFSTEIPLESSVCDDLGYFLDLKRGASYWADTILESICNNSCRFSRNEEVKMAGFDSKTEANRLAMYYKNLIVSDIK